MTHDTFPFTESDDEMYGEEKRRNRKAMVVAGGVAAVLVLGAGGWLLVGGSSGSSTPADAFVTRGHPHVAIAASKPLGTSPQGLPVAYKAPLGRDPFKALYVVPAAAASPAAGSSVTGSTSPSTLAPPSAPAATGTGTAPSVSGTGTNGSTPTGSTRYALKLLTISKPNPQVRDTAWSVDGVTKTILPGQRFGKYGEIVVLAYGQNASGTVDTAVIQVGDDSPIDVAIGQTVSVL